MSKLTNLLSELRRRRVFRMTAIYIVAAWVVVQVASELFPAVNIPENAIRYIWVAALIGFPFAVLFSWKYDVTPEGIRRTPDADEDSPTDHSLTRVDYALLAALAIIVVATVLGVGQRLVEVQTQTAMAPATRVIDPNSIAVLPLENLSPDPEDAYFAAGVHDALISSLAKISALIVTSRTSTLRVDPKLSVPDIGRRLGVAKLLEGSVLMDGDRVRVIVQLIDAASDQSLWADTFERDMNDIIGLQNEVARTITDVIEVRLTPREEAVLARTPKVRPDTYRGYLKGMYQFRQGSPDATRRGIEILEDVVREDPTSALALAGLAVGYADLAHSPLPGDAYPKAKAAADMALQMDPDLAEVHLAVAMYLVYYEWDFAGAEQAYKRAIRLNPSLAMAHYHLGWLYELFGPEREDDSLAEGERARELNSLSAEYLGGLADQYRDACRYEDALRLAREAVRLDPEHWAGWASLGNTYVQLGRFDEAIDAHKKLASTQFAPFIGATYAAAGLEDKARQVAASLKDMPGTEFLLASIYANLGERESALQWIAAAGSAKVPWYPWLLGHSPGIENIADDPRLQARAAALGLPDPRSMGCGT